MPTILFAGGGLGFHRPFGGDEHGISAARLPINALIGVFLDDAQPDTTLAPEAIDFGVLGLDFSTLSLSLKQMFFIDDGRNAAGDTQVFLIPEGATRLFLGTMDGFQVQFRQGHGTPTRGRDVLRVPTTGLDNCSKTCAPSMDANGNACTNCVVICDHGKGEATVHQWCLAAPTSGGN